MGSPALEACLQGNLLPRAEPGWQWHQPQPEQPFLGEGSRNAGGITFGEQLTGMPSLLPALGRRLLCWVPLSAAQGRGRRPRLAINLLLHVCPLALTSAGPRLMDYPFNLTSP